MLPRNLRSIRASMVRNVVAIATVLALAVAGAPLAGAHAITPRVSATYLRHNTSVRFRFIRVMGHRVHMVTWRPGDRHIYAHVSYSAALRTPLDWARARDPRSMNLAVMNGGTWSWTTGKLHGTVRVNGKLISWARNRPAVGFLRTGGVVFGARSAMKRGTPNIVAGVAYLVRGGVPVHSRSHAPWATAGQWACGPRGTDGAYGCFRSNVVRFTSGRVGLVEIAYADMPTAARILKRLGAVDALTFDSGGSATIWTALGDGGGCTRGRFHGQCFGGSTDVGLNWQRSVPDVSILTLR
jgi:Phosphodiester glycosidase